MNTEQSQLLLKNGIPSLFQYLESAEQSQYQVSIMGNVANNFFDLYQSQIPSV